METGKLIIYKQKNKILYAILAGCMRKESDKAILYVDAYTLPCANHQRTQLTFFVSLL